MTDLEEDSVIPTTTDSADNDLSDETQDFRLLASLSQTADHPTLPRRGEKDFEHHGTLSQEDTLAASRAAMHDALSFPRTHNPKNNIIGVFDPAQDSTIIDRPTGPNFKSIGKGDSFGRLSLLPEETLYLVERGSLDLRWRSEELEGIPVSLQAAYAYLLGSQGLTLERYTVYTGLKRNGYVVQRSPSWYPEDYYEEAVTPRDARKPPATGLFARLYKLLFDKKPPDLPPLGPLVQPGLYRSYGPIYRALAMIPTHDPSAFTERECKRTSASTAHSASPTHPRLRPSFYVWKPNTPFKKSAPPPPDFRIAVVNAREEKFPEYQQLDDLLQCVPYMPPPPGSEGQTYKRVRHGWRNVILAVVDQGVISYVRVADAGFGMEKVYEGRARGGGGKRGGAPGRGRGSGRGKGRGR